MTDFLRRVIGRQRNPVIDIERQLMTPSDDELFLPHDSEASGAATATHTVGGVDPQGKRISAFAEKFLSSNEKLRSFLLRL